jgi:hypothetical protein
MSRLAANPAGSPLLSLRTAEMATPSVITRNSGAELPSPWIAVGHSSAPAIAPDFCSQTTDENFGSVCVFRYVSRLSLGHCFGAFPAPGGTAPLCFDFAALRVMVPP